MSPGLLLSSFWGRNSSSLQPTPGSFTCCQETIGVLTRWSNRSPAVPQQDLAHAVGHTALLGPWYHHAMAISTLALGARSIPGLLHPEMAVKRSKLSWLGSERGPTQLREVSLPLLGGCREHCAFGSGWGGGLCCQTTLSTASLLPADPNPAGNI